MKKFYLTTMMLFIIATLYSNSMDWNEAIDVNLSSDDAILFSNMDDNFVYLYSYSGKFIKIDKVNTKIIKTESFDLNIFGAFKLNSKLYITLLNLFSGMVYYKSSDDFGETWHDYKPNFNTSISPLILDGIISENNEIYLCGFNLQIQAFFAYSSDGGQNFKITIFENLESNIKIYKDASTHILYLCTTNGLYTSTDNGNNWVKHDNIGVESDAAVRTLNFYEGIFFATDDKSNLFRSYDNGITWNKYTFPETGSAWFVDMIKYNNYFLLPGRNTTNNKAILYFSYDNGINWSRILEMDGVARNSYIINDSIYVILRNGKIFKTWLLPLSISDKANGISIHPNPATDYIYINSGDVFLSVAKKPIRIYNTLGQCVSHLTPTLSKGEGVRIDVSHLPPGVYFVRVGSRAEKFVKW